jgi:hypothetical protein
MERIVLATAAILACGLASAAPIAASHGHPGAPAASSLATTSPPHTTVLYSQNGTDSGIGIVSQNFESSFDVYDSRAADDFIVGRKAKITEIDVVGVYFNGSGLAASENVTFYKNKKGLPGAVLADLPNLPGTDNGTGTFWIPISPQALPRCCRPPMWVSVQANMDFNPPGIASSGEWGWENQTTVVGAAAAWENPGDGFGTGCTTYTTETSCIADGQGDHMFTIKGKAKSAAR